MPAKNAIKQYRPNGFYHVYNRGVDKRVIFLDDHDYQTFLSLLKSYLSPLVTDQSEGTIDPRPFRIQRRQNMNLANELKLCAYCLMPNHFHLLVKQNTSSAMTKLLQRLCTSYVTYFNKKYQRTGSLFQGVYKAVPIDNENLLLHLSRYIHLNPVTTKKIGLFATVTGSLATYPYSSYSKYVDRIELPWIDIQTILNLSPTYVNFVEDLHQSSPDDLDTTLLEPIED